MKIKYCLIFTFILQFTLFSQVNWQVKNPTPQTDLRSVYFFNTNTGIVCGAGGLIYKTTNAGYSWIQKTSPTSRKLNSMWFYNSTSGVAVGDTGTVIYTTDSGENWSLQSPVTNYDLRKLFFYDNFNVIVVCSGGRILKSSDSGTSWSLINLNVSDLFEIDKSLNTLYIGSTNSKFLKSTDVGTSWQVVTPGVSNSYIFQVHFVSSDTAFMYTNNYVYYKTTNSGVSWNQISGLYAPQYANYSDTRFGIGVSNSGATYKTTNGGNYWQEIGPSNLQGSYVYSLFILDTNNLYGAGYGGRVIHHGNGFSNIWDIIGGSANDCRDVSFLNSQKGFITAEEEQFWTTTDGGNKWNIQGLCNNNYFESPRTFIRSVYCKDSLTVFRTRGDGYAGHGNTGKIEVSINGGNTWGVSLSQIYGEFYKIDGAGNSILCAAGIIIRNDGSGWYDYLSVSQTNLTDFHFINENTGIIIGYQYSSQPRKIYSTSNNGANWNEQSVGRYLNCVYLRNSGVGLIGCDTGRVLRTTDFGANWTLYSTSTTRDINSIYMLSDNTVWAVGDNGAMLYSINSGLNWTNAAAYTSNRLNKIKFFDQYTGFALGYNGTVLKTTDGGLTFVHIGSNEIPSKYHIEQNYPNPFNPVTRIDFSIPENGNIKIEIFDAAGKLIEILADKEFNAGFHSIEWNGSNVSSGIYFYRISTKQFTETKKMMLLK